MSADPQDRDVEQRAREYSDTVLHREDAMAAYHGYLRGYADARGEIEAAHALLREAERVLGWCAVLIELHLGEVPSRVQGQVQCKPDIFAATYDPAGPAKETSE